MLSELMRELPDVAGIGGEELGPPQSAAEWRDDPLVVLRRGDV